MKPFLFKTALFVTLVLLGIQGLKWYCPYWWGNDFFNAKIDYLKTRPEGYNAYFLGSSRIYHQIDPAVIDHEANQNLKQKLHSFNLGTPATFNPETYYLLENLIRSDTVAAKYIFIELQNMESIPKTLMHTSRKKYCINLKEFLFAAQWFWETDALPLVKRLATIKNYSVAFFENTFCIGQLADMLQGAEGLDAGVIGKRGYYELNSRITKFEAMGEGMAKAREEFLKDSGELAQRKIEAENIFKKTPENSRCSRVHLARINRIIAMGRQKKIRIIFILPPRAFDQETLKVYYHIPVENRIELANPVKYPRFYNAAYYFDRGHFNEQGTRIFSTELGRKISELLQPKTVTMRTREDVKS